MFDEDKLNEYIIAAEPDFTPIRINEEIYNKALGQYWTADFCSNFSSLDHYLKYGVGYVVMKDGEIISGASSYSYCEGAIDITIETKAEYRGQGLAFACASKVILECMEKGFILNGRLQICHLCLLQKNWAITLKRNIGCILFNRNLSNRVTKRFSIKIKKLKSLAKSNDFSFHNYSLVNV